MEPLATAAGLCQSIIDWVKQVKELKQQCEAVRDQAETLLPLLEKYTDELRGSASRLAAHDSRWVTSLVAALTGAQDAVKCCAQNPIQAKLRAGKYLGSLNDALQAIRDAMQAVSLSHAAVSAQARNELREMDDSLDDLKALMVSAMSRHESQAEAFKQEMKEALLDQNKTLLEAIAKRERIDGGAEALRRQMADMEAHYRWELETVKSSAEKYNLEAVLELSKLALGGETECPSDLKCPISQELMDDPVMFVQSGNTYERKKIMHWHVDHPRHDPLTGVTYDRATLAPNLSVKRLITEWRENRASPFKAPASTVLPMPPPPPTPTQLAELAKADAEHASKFNDYFENLTRKNQRIAELEARAEADAAAVTKANANAERAVKAKADAEARARADADARRKAEAEAAEARSAREKAVAEERGRSLPSTTRPLDAAALNLAELEARGWTALNLECKRRGLPDRGSLWELSCRLKIAALEARGWKALNLECKRRGLPDRGPTRDLARRLKEAASATSEA